MITIVNISDTKFSFNGITYFKNFTPFVVGNKVSIINTYDACISLTNFPTIYSDFTVNGVTYGSVTALQNALLPVIFTRTSLVDLSNKISGSLSTNYLPKATGATTLGNSLIYDNGTNVGIGTTSPSAKLHISGNVNSAFLYSDGAGSGYSFADIRNTGARLAFGVENSTGSTSFTGALAYSSWIGSLQSGTAFQIVAGNSLSTSFLANGNVGIGTSSPTGLLHLFGSSAALRIQNNGTGNMQLGQWDGSTNRIEGGGRDLNIVANDAYNVRFETNYSERMRITSGGNVGIGTTAPTSKLHVSGTAGNSEPFIKFDATSSNSTFNWVSSAFASNLTAGNNLVHFIGQAASSKNSGYLGFKYAGNGSNDNILSLGLFAVDNVLNINGAGNVGIGTTAPTSKLQVVGLPSYADNTTALAGGLTVGAFYHTAGVLKVVI